MSIITPLTPQVPGLSSPSLGPDKSDKSYAAKADPLVATPRPETEATEGMGEGDKVSISASSDQLEQSNQPAPIYAEIWKGGVKVAQIDMHGHVTSYSGLVAPGGGSGIAGQFLAAQRAVQVAQQIGGEIRAAGQSVDSQTLLMRAQLARTYAV